MLLAIGGWNGNGVIASSEIINLNTTVGCSFTSYPFAVSQHASSATSDGVVTCGGWDGSQSFNTCKKLTKQGSWDTFPDMNSKRRGFGLRMVDGLLWAVGGYPGGNSMEFIDIENPTEWSQQTMPFSVSYHCLTELSRKQLIVIGGHDGGVSK